MSRRRARMQAELEALRVQHAATRPDTARDRARLAELESQITALESLLADNEQPADGALRRALCRLFSVSELWSLCADLGVDYELLPAGGKEDQVRELVRYLERRGRLGELRRAVRAARPQAEL
jgi:hypothetical protein